MAYRLPKCSLLTVALLVAGLVALTLWGCGGSGGHSSDASGTTVSVVFPQQGAMLQEEGWSKAAAWQHSTHHGTFARIMAEIQHFSEVSPAYAQVVPLGVSRLLLTITGPGITDPIQEEINPTTGRTTVPVPVGNARVFEVQAFPSDIPLVNFIGRITADVPSSGTNVTVNMQAVTLNSIQVTPTNAQIAKGTVQRFTAMGAFSDGSVQDLTTLVDWASSNTSVAVVSNAEGIEGLASGMQEGATQITATLLNSLGGTTLTVTAAEVVAITVAPATPSIAVGIGLQFSATGFFTDGTSQELTMVAGWTSSNPAVAAISPIGLATALAVGSTTISATFQGSTGETVLTVTPVELAAITVAPAVANIAVGTRLQFTATGIFTDGSSLSLTTSATWTSSRTGVASITNPGGLATAVAAGSTTIRATFQGITGTTDLTVRALELAAITVTPAIPTIALGTRIQFVATGLFTDGTSQDLTNSAVWASADPAIATISNAADSRGLAVAVAAGSTVMSATFQNITGTVDLTVTAAQLSAITVSPAISSIAIGTALQFTATGIFSDGTSQNLDISATWTSSDELVATITPGGLATAVAVGNAIISATFQGITGSTLLSVTAAQLAAITVSPAIPSIALGTRLQFTATGIFSNGSNQNLTTQVTWTTSPISVCAIDATGQATALTIGSCTINATFQGIIGGTTLTITALQLAAITVSPAIPSIALGTRLQFTATGIFSNGSNQNLTTQVTWTASPASVCIIGPTGQATALTIGSCIVTATSQGVSGSTTLSVTAVELEALVVTPTNPTIAQGTTLQFTATGIFTSGSSQDLTTQVTWTTDPDNICAITPTGLATALAIGPCSITATFQAVSGSTTLTVTDAPLADLIVIPVNPVIGDSTTLQFTATGIFSDGRNQNLTTQVAWTASDDNFCAIDATGLATAIDAGSCTISASLDGLSDSTLLTVTPATLADIVVTPINATIGEDTTLQFTATGIFTDGLNQDLTADATWASSNPAVAQISNDTESEGLATALIAGSSLISATFETVTDSATLTVSSAALAAITVTPVDATIPIGPSLQFTAIGFLEDGTPQDLTTAATWLSSNSEIVDLSPDGLAAGLSDGAVTISATVNGVTGTTALTVTVADLAAIVVTPANAQIAVNEDLQFIATGVFDDGGQADFTDQVTWASSNQAVATISNDPIDGSQGRALGNSVGNTTISATFEGLIGTTGLTVTPNGYYLHEGNHEIRPRFASILGTATLTVIMLGIFTRMREERTRKRSRR